MRGSGSLLDPKSAYSAYVSPYYVEHGRGTESGAVTKHYCAGAERLISKVVTRTSGTHGEGLSGTKCLTQSSAQTEESTYYYFTDHLGSTTYITDRSGRTSQYAAYTPYGETFKEYRNVTPYKFNGKELDDETGYYYYGVCYRTPCAAGSMSLCL